jgi:hypothetical protein
VNPHNIECARVMCLMDLPNVGKKSAEDLRLLGYLTQEQIVEASPLRYV